MCTSYIFTFEKGFEQHFDIEKVASEDLKHEFVAFPGNIMPVVTRNSPNKVEFMQWGLIPNWWKQDPKIGKKLVNARSETVFEKPLFRSAVKNRCIIPSSSFYEWTGEKGSKQKINFRSDNSPHLALAGLYDQWKDGEGKILQTYTMITQEADVVVGKYHNKQPVILDLSNMYEWLDKTTSPSRLKTLLQSKSKALLVVNEAGNPTEKRER